jgi:hypothetical protein
MKVRTQSARHVVELNSLNEKVTMLRQEQMEARSDLASAGGSFGSGSGGGGGGGAITGGGGRVIRGGSVTGETARATIRGGGVPQASK